MGISQLFYAEETFAIWKNVGSRLMESDLDEAIHFVFVITGVWPEQSSAAERALKNMEKQPQYSPIQLKVITPPNTAEKYDEIIACKGVLFQDNPLEFQVRLHDNFHGAPFYVPCVHQSMCYAF